MRGTVIEPDLSDPIVESPRKTSVGVGIVRTMRPRQWVKNVLVFAAPIVGGVIAEPRALLATLVAFVSFCLCASAVYAINDVLDAEADRAHPTKRNRPIASGSVPVGVAVAVAIVLFAVGLGITLFISWRLALVMACYCVIQIAYCLWLKHMAVLDIAVVSSGFLLRAIAGGVAANAFPSQWFLLVAVFGSLLMVAGKRYGEIIASASRGGVKRGSLKNYTPEYLRFVWQSAATVLVLGYSLWAFSLGKESLWISASVAPFLLAVLRYCQHIDRGDAEAPEEIALGDRMLQALAVILLIMLVAGIYIAPLIAGHHLSTGSHIALF